ncbi:5'(3')-deoxyribonucleotidase [Emticicia oligotrophica DSM 17448]|uniref:5'(3')-deoxyribonucleotidase n=2 Tax=Leadbetterellaceae TaxID=3141702 RepID=A0ABN4APZ9_EMTOG|nr:5'(3')-deoxyribonucleotidase [Emticicia oligotrophica DSM 17448]
MSALNENIILAGKQNLIRMTKKRIAIDMDDVLAAAGKKILATYNQLIGTNFKDEDFDGKAYFDVLDEQYYPVIREKIFEPGFFRDMEVMPDAIEVVKKLHDRFEVFIVSAATEFPNSLKEKIEWLEEHFPFISWKNVVLCGDKTIISADYLIDDHEKNLKPFKGKALMFNATHNQLLTDYDRFYNWKEIEAFFDAQ